jgi:apolipoprotein N-acyltransferase
VVYPEYGFDEITDKNLNERINRDKQKTYFVTSKQIVVDKGHRNVMLLGNTKEGITQSQDKHRLIPGGEDFSFLPRLLLIMTGRQATLSYFDYNRQVVKGKKSLTPFKTDDGTQIGAAVCSSIISPEDYRSLTRQGATVLTNSASLDIFEGSRVFAYQQKSLAKFMSIANSRYFLQSANSASAYALDNNGKQITETKGISTVNVMAKDNSRKTPYSYLGEYLAVIGAAVCVWLFIDRQRKKIKR